MSTTPGQADPRRLITWTSPAPPEDVTLRAEARQPDGPVTITLSRGTPGTAEHVELAWTCTETELDALGQHFVQPVMDLAARRREWAQAAAASARTTRAASPPVMPPDHDPADPFLLVTLPEHRPVPELVLHKRTCGFARRRILGANVTGGVQSRYVNADTVAALVRTAVDSVNANGRRDAWPPLHPCGQCQPFGVVNSLLIEQGDALRRAIDGHPDRTQMAALDQWADSADRAAREAQRLHRDAMPRTTRPTDGGDR